MHNTQHRFLQLPNRLRAGKSHHHGVSGLHVCCLIPQNLPDTRLLHRCSTHRAPTAKFDQNQMICTPKNQELLNRTCESVDGAVEELDSTRARACKPVEGWMAPMPMRSKRARVARLAAMPQAQAPHMMLVVCSPVKAKQCCNPCDRSPMSSCRATWRERMQELLCARARTGESHLSTAALLHMFWKLKQQLESWWAPAQAVCIKFDGRSTDK